MKKDTLAVWWDLVDAAPEAVALIKPDGSTISRVELDEQSDELGEDWLEASMGARRLLVLYVGNGVEWMVAYLAALKANVVVVPIDRSTPQAEAMASAQALRAEMLWDGSNLYCIDVERPRVFRSEAIVLGKLTSGSTGAPKVFFFTHEEMIADGRHVIAAMGLRPEDINLGAIPWGHSYGLGNIVYPLLLQGTCTTWTASPFPQDLLDTCAQVQATVFPTVPTLLRVLNRSAAEGRVGFASLRLVISAGARLEPKVAQEFQQHFGLVPHNFYGSSETGGIAYDASGEASLTGRSVGVPFEGVRIVPSRGRRFYVESEAVYRFENRSARSGDCARVRAVDYGEVNAQGELVLERRATGILKIGGRRINPAEVELLLERLPLVEQARVFELPLDGEPVLAAAVESSADRRLVLQQIREELPKRLRPKKVRCFEAFPTNRRGKVAMAEIQREFISPSE